MTAGRRPPNAKTAERRDGSSGSTFFRTLFECQFAPLAETWRDVHRVAQIVHQDGQAAYEAFSAGAFEGWGKRPINVLLDHDPTKVAGSVTVIAPHKDWWLASFVLDGPYAARAADWIERCGKLSPGFDPEEMDPDFARPFSPAHYPTHWHSRALLREISVLPPGAIAWYEGAKVTRVYEPKEAPPSTRPGLLVREIARRRVGNDLVVEMSDGTAEITAAVTRRSLASSKPRSRCADGTGAQTKRMNVVLATAKPVRTSKAAPPFEDACCVG